MQDIMFEDVDAVIDVIFTWKASVFFRQAEYLEEDYLYLVKAEFQVFKFRYTFDLPLLQVHSPSGISKSVEGLPSF